MRLSTLALILALVMILDASTLVYSMFEGVFPSIVERGAPTAYRNLYVHVPVSIAAYATLTLAAIAALAYMLSRSLWFYELLDSSVKIGVPLGLASFLTGSIWASESWGSFWTWDPRQTSVLILVLAYTLYFAVKNSVRDPDRKPLVASAYAFAAYATVPLSFIVPRIAESLHPTPEQTREFVVGAPELFATRIILAVTLSILLVATLYKSSRVRVHRMLTILSLVITVLVIATSTYQLLSSLGALGQVGRVLDAKVDGDRLWVEVSSNHEVYEGYYVGQPPVTPLVVTANGREQVTLIDHIVGFEYEGGYFRKLEVLNHPVVPLNAIVYSILSYPLVILAYLAYRGGRT